MTADLDTGVGRLLDKIEELGIADSTFVIYLADNGAVPWVPPNKTKHFGHPSLLNDRSNNFPLRGGKWTLFEGGIRVPWVVAGPGIASGSWCKVPVVGWDLLPTIADLAGYRETLPNDLDGGSFRSLLENEGNGSISRTFPGLVYHRYSKGYPHSAIRVGNYKLIKFWQEIPYANDTGKFEPVLLFNLKEDLGETRNLVDSMPQKALELEELLADYLKRVQPELLQ